MVTSNHDVTDETFSNFYSSSTLDPSEDQVLMDSVQQVEMPSNDEDGRAISGVTQAVGTMHGSKSLRPNSFSSDL